MPEKDVANVSEDQQKAQAEAERLKRRALDIALLAKTQRLSSNTLNLSKVMIKCDGKDIVKKGSVRKNRFLLVFAAQIAPVAGGRMGTLAQLDGKNPVMYFEFPEGRLKFFGTLVFPKNKYLVCKVANKDIQAEDVLESMIVFSECWWIGRKEDNPEEKQLPLPKELLSAKRHENYSFSTSAAGTTGEAGPKGDAAPKPKAAPKSTAVVCDESAEGTQEAAVGDGAEVVATVMRPQRTSSRHKGNTPKYTVDAEEDEEEDSLEEEEDDEDDAEEDGGGVDQEVVDDDEDQIEDADEVVEEDTVEDGSAVGGGAKLKGKALAAKRRRGRKVEEEGGAGEGSEKGKDAKQKDPPAKKTGTIQALFAAATKGKEADGKAAGGKAASKTPAQQKKTPATPRKTTGKAKTSPKKGKAPAAAPAATAAPSNNKRKRQAVAALSPSVIELPSDTDEAPQTKSVSKRPSRAAGAAAAKRLKVQQSRDDVITLSGASSEEAEPTPPSAYDFDSDFEA